MLFVLTLTLLSQAGQKCITVSSTRVCGYECAENGSTAQCAQTPFGVCAKNSAQVVCFDPPLWLSAVWGGAPSCFDPEGAVICAKGAATAKAQCVTQSNSVFCGYACARAGVEVACARTPDGTCDTSGPGKPVCFDPPMRGGSAACLEAAKAR